MRQVIVGGTAIWAAMAFGGDGGPAFVDVASQVGLSYTTHRGTSFPGIFQPLMQQEMGQGAAVADYDGDGDLDVYLVGAMGFENRLFQNQLAQTGTASFSDVTAVSGIGLNDTGVGRLAHFVDLDNDTDLDLLLINDGDVTPASLSRVFRNDAGVFTDVTDGSNFSTLGYLRCGASLADYNGDGLLDVYVTTWTFEVGSGLSRYPGANLLFENDGGLVFSDVTADVGLDGLARDSFTAIFTDFDEDFDTDLFVAVDHTIDEFYSFDAGMFSRTTFAVGTTHTGNDMGVACADADNDGDLDLYSTNITDGSPACGVGTTQGNAFYVNQLAETGQLSFQNQALLNGSLDTHWGWGVEFTDVENDGDLDILAATGFDQFLMNLFGDCSIIGTPTVLMQNDGSMNFSYDPVGGLPGGDSRALICFDFDRDGDEDALITGVDDPVILLENVTTSMGNWLGVDVRQRPGLNHFGIGVRVEVRSGGVSRTRVILAGESYLAGTPAEVHFGLGDASTADVVRVYWTDGSLTTLTNVPTDQYLTIVQPTCPCELSGNGSVDVGDLLLYLGGWFDDDLSADLDGNDAVDTADLLQFLACWFDACV